MLVPTLNKKFFKNKISKCVIFNLYPIHRVAEGIMFFICQSVIHTVSPSVLFFFVNATPLKPLTRISWNFVVIKDMIFARNLDWRTWGISLFHSKVRRHRGHRKKRISRNEHVEFSFILSPLNLIVCDRFICMKTRFLADCSEMRSFNNSLRSQK